MVRPTVGAAWNRRTNRQDLSSSSSPGAAVSSSASSSPQQESTTAGSSSSNETQNSSPQKEDSRGGTAIETEHVDGPQQSHRDDDEGADHDGSSSAAAPPSRGPSHSSKDDNEDDSLVMESYVPKLDRVVHHVQSFRYKVGKLVNSKNVQFFIVLLIAVNAVMMGIGTFGFVKNDPVVNNAFEQVDQAFLIVFTIELGMQFVYYGWRLLLDGWLVFDLVIIVTSWSFASLQIIRAFRIFRALRLITRVKVMKNLILALFGVMPRMFAIGLLLFLVSYIFAVMCTQLFGTISNEGLTEFNYFGRLDNTFFTLFQIMTLDNWADVSRDVMLFYSWAWLPIIVYVIVTGFVVVNLIIAVICDAISMLHDDEKKKLYGENEDGSAASESAHPALHEDVREQLDTLEENVSELTRMQEETMISLQNLTRQLREHRMRRQALYDT